MKQQTIERTGEVVSLESRAARRFREAWTSRHPLQLLLGVIDKRHFHIGPVGIRKPKDNEPTRKIGKVYNFTDKEAELEFFRWASCLNEEIVLSIFKPGHPKAGQSVGPYDPLGDDETNDEIKTVFEWGKELAELEFTELLINDHRIDRIHHITKMFIDCKLIWRGGPKWWHQL